MKEDIDKVNKEKEQIDKKAPYSYEEYCRRFKTSKRDNKRNFKIILLLIFLIVIGILIYFLINSMKETSNKIDEDVLVINENSETPVLKEAWDKGIKLELNEVNLDGNHLNIKMMLDYRNLDKDLINEDENKFEISTKGHFEIFIGDRKMKTFSPTIQSVFLDKKTEITVKAEVPISEIKAPIRLDYVCNKLDVIYSSTKTYSIDGNWGFSYNINDISNIEQGDILKVNKSSSLVNENFNVKVDVDNIIVKGDTMDISYMYGGKSKRKINNKYSLEVKVLNSFGGEIVNLTNKLNENGQVKRITSLKVGKETEKITLVPRLTENTFFSNSNVIIEGVPIEIELKKLINK